MALERHGDYVVGTQSEIDAYRSQQADSQAGSMMAGTVAIAGVAVVLGVALMLVSASTSIADAAKASAEQIKIWHNMYSKLWGQKKADYMLKKARRKLRFRAFKYCIWMMIFPILYIVGIPLLIGILFGIPVLLAVLTFDTRNPGQMFDGLPYSSMPEIWNSFWHEGGRYEFMQGFGRGFGEIRDNATPALIILAIAMPFLLWWAVRISRKSADSALLSAYNNVIYRSYPKAKCPHCRKRVRVLSLGQCRNCFKFMRHLSYEDAKLLSEYRMVVNYDVYKTANNEFFSAEVGRTTPWNIGTWLIILLMFTLPFAVFLGGIYVGTFFLIRLYIANGGITSSFYLVTIGGILVTVFLALRSQSILGKIFSGRTKREIQRFSNAIKSVLLAYNLPTSNWSVM